MTTTPEFDGIRSRLNGVKGRGDRFVALCPAHDDTHQSLSVSLGRGGKVLLKCHAGCTFEAISAALGGAGVQSHQHRASAGPTTEVEVASYVYTDENEAPLFRVIRYDVLDHERQRIGKTFKQQRHIGANDFEWGLGQTRRVLYRLPTIIEAVACGRTIFVVEGEKDADRLAGLGFDATTCAGGADAKWLDDYGVALRGADVIILPDNDEPGKKHAAKVTAALHGLARSVRTIELPALPPKGDVSDWLDAGHSPDELRRLIASAPAEENPYPAPVCLRDAPPPEPIRWTVQGLLPAAELSLVYGDGGSYKSTLALHLACAVAGGYRAFGHFETTPGAVLLVSAEDPIQVIRNRVTAMCRGHGWDLRTIESRLHAHALDGVSLADPKWCATLLEDVRRLNAGLVILDPLAELIDGEENSASEMRPMVKAARALKDVTGAAVVLVHHAGKEAIGKRKQDRVRGSSAFYSAARSVYLVSGREDGAAVECVKFSRAERRKDFVVSRTIDADPKNEAEWTVARFTYTPTKVAELDRAEAHIIAQLQGGVRLSTTDLRKSAQGTGISAADIQRSLNVLVMRRLLAFEGGDPGKAKAWFLIEPETLPDESRQGRQGLFEPCPAGSNLAVAGPAQRPDTLPAPIGAGSGQGARFELAGLDSKPRNEAA